MSGVLYVGTSGFAYPEWKGGFYPVESRDSSLLEWYARELPAVEINYTFRRLPAEKTLERWSSQSPEGFRFALKASQRITHWQRLADADESVSTFLDRARLLGERLGPILFQCPPTLEFDRGLIESFLAYLPPICRYAMEFRHGSWLAARGLLEEQGVAWCVADVEEGVGDSRLGEAPFAYVRLRREDYTEDDLAGWAKRVVDVLAEGRDAYVFMKHEGGEAPRRALRLREMVGAG